MMYSTLLYIFLLFFIIHGAISELFFSFLCWYLFCYIIVFSFVTSFLISTPPDLKIHALDPQQNSFSLLTIL